ncbi:hypothetical protein JNM05_04435 [bacterium]|nr:hypothetical protein [bacterium]
MKSILNYLVISAMVFVFFIGCSDSKESDNATLSFMTEQVLGKSSVPGALTIDTAKILITRIKFENQGNSDSSEFRTGAIVVNLNLNGAVQTVDAANIPQGIYDHIKFELHKPNANENIPDPDFITGSSGNDRYSIIIIGTYNSSRFVYRSRNTINQSVNIDPALIIADSIGTANLTLAVNITNWFSDGDGGYLDPTDVNASNVSAIENTIKESFRGFKDNDRDGNEND